MYDTLATKENNINTSAFVLKTKYQSDKEELEKKIPYVSSLETKTVAENKMLLVVLLKK